MKRFLQWLWDWHIDYQDGIQYGPDPDDDIGTPIYIQPRWKRHLAHFMCWAFCRGSVGEAWEKIGWEGWK